MSLTLNKKRNTHSAHSFPPTTGITDKVLLKEASRQEFTCAFYQQTNRQPIKCQKNKKHMLVLYVIIGIITACIEE